MGAAFGAAADSGRSVWAALAPGLLPGLARGAAYAAAVFGVSHSALSGLACSAVAAAAQQLAVFVALVGPRGWASTDGLVDRAGSVAVRERAVRGCVRQTQTNVTCDSPHSQAGMLICTSMFELWPRATRLSPEAASAGAVVGAAGSGVALGTAAMLCALSSGCVSHHA